MDHYYSRFTYMWITETEAAHSSPGPGAFQSSEFRPQVGKGMTFGRQFRPAGWSAKIKEITRLPWELDGDDDDDPESGRTRRVGRFRAPLQRHATSKHDGTITRRHRRPSSAPPSSRFRRACARGRRLDSSSTTGGGGGQGTQRDKTACSRGSTPCHRKQRSIAHVVKEAGRKRRAKAAAAAAAIAAGAAAASKGATSRRNTGGRGAVFGSAPQRPPDEKRTPAPTSYRPVTLDEASRNGKVVSVGGTSRRELFPPSPDTPGPEWYTPESIQGPTSIQESTRRRRQRRTTRQIATRDNNSRGAAPSPPPLSTNYNRDDGSVAPKRRPQPSSTSTTSSADNTRPAPLLLARPRVMLIAEVGTFGSSDRFPKDPTRRPGVGEYDLRAAERAAGGASTASSLTFGRKPSGAPYDPALNRYLRADDLETPSAHAYFPESAKGGGGDGGLGGNAVAPPAWSFGGKRSAPRPPDGPGPGRFRPPYNNGIDPCCSSSSATTGVKFGAGREVMSGCVSGVPWVEVEERAARGDGGGGDAKLYLPERNRMGARAFMRSRALPRPGRVAAPGCRVDLARGR